MEPLQRMTRKKADRPDPEDGDLEAGDLEAGDLDEEALDAAASAGEEEDLSGPDEVAADDAPDGEAPDDDGPDDDAGPDVPAPPLEELRAALAWAFAKETIPAEVLDRFALHAHRMLERNRQVNLTAILDPREVAAKHYLDSWRVTQLLPLIGRRVVDLGTGAGFPGLPIALTEPMASLVLVDSNQKKAAFLKEVCDELAAPNLEVHAGRAEEYLATNRVDTVLVRAVSSVRENVRVLRKVRHSLKDLVMLKGPSWSREVRAAEREAERLGFTLDTVWEHELPGEMGGRAILVYRAPGGAGM